MKGVARAARPVSSTRRRAIVMTCHRRILLALCLLLSACCSLAQAQTLRVSTSDGAVNFNGIEQLIFPAGSVVINGRAARIGASGGSSLPGSGLTRLNGMIGPTQTFSF